MAMGNCALAKLASDGRFAKGASAVTFVRGLAFVPAQKSGQAVAAWVQVLVRPVPGPSR